MGVQTEPPTAMLRAFVDVQHVLVWFGRWF